MVKTLKKLFQTYTEPKYLFLAAFIILFLLLARDPFSIRTLIPNLEPFPDTLHYIVPARNFLDGNGFVISREGGSGEITPGVPPLYSLMLLPALIIYSDPRVFYLTNVILTLLSLALFYLILKKLTENRWIIGFMLFLFVTNFFIYWYPQWAMAENLLLPLFLGAIYMLLLKVTKRNMVIAAALTVSFYATKYAAAPLSLFYFFIYLTKIVVERKKELRSLVVYIVSLLIFFVPMQAYAYFVGGINHFSTLISIILGVFPSFYKPVTTQEGAGEWYSSYHLVINFPKYLKASLGASERFLWDSTPILHRSVAILGYMGLVVGVFKKRIRFVSLSLLVLILGQVLFISTFYALDMRYFITAIPSLLIGFAIFLNFAYELCRKRKLQNIFYIFITVFFAFFLFTSAIRIKDQIVLNIRYAETPWYYISVLRLNNYFTDDLVEDNNKPVVISPMVPYLIDFYSNGNYDLLPLSTEQEFRSRKEETWGINDYSDLISLYNEKIKAGKSLYVSTYGLGNESYLHRSFDLIAESFELQEVASECFDQCRIYKLELIKEDEN